MLKELLISIRPKQWYKNLVIFICIIFSENFLNFDLWLKIICAFIIFCMLSGSIYIINDILDIKNDRKHPRKRKRPIASGKLKISHAYTFAAVLCVGGLFGAFLLNKSFLIISIIFVLISLYYSVYLKHILLVDILTISINFVLRAIAGCLAISVFISPWLIICAFLLALYLAIIKRRHEMVLLGDDAKAHRKALIGYSPKILDQMVSIITATLIMSYSLYTFLTDNIYMMLTIPFAIYGLLKYQHLMYARDIGGEPEMLFKDTGIVTCIILWIMLVLMILIGVPEVIVNLVLGL